MIAHLSYVICDRCGVPASQPMGNAAEARKMVPAYWSRIIVTAFGRKIDVCPRCAR